MTQHPCTPLSAALFEEKRLARCCHRAGGFVGVGSLKELSALREVELVACVRKWASAVRLARRGLASSSSISRPAVRVRETSFRRRCGR